MESTSAVEIKPDNNLQNEMNFKIEQTSSIINQQDNQNASLSENVQEETPDQLDPNLSTNSNEYPLLNAQAKERNKKRKFTQEEDDKLRDLVQIHGQKQWDVIARNIGTDRTARQCRDRWKHYLSPNVSQKEWNITEDRLLLNCTQKYGAQWAALVKFFPGRTDINLKNRWNKLQRKSKKLFQTNPNVQIPKLPANPEHIHFLNPGMMNQNLNANNQNEELPQPFANTSTMTIQAIPPIPQQTSNDDNNKDEALNPPNNNNNDNTDTSITAPVTINVVNNNNSVISNTSHS